MLLLLNKIYKNRYKVYFLKKLFFITLFLILASCGKTNFIIDKDMVDPFSISVQPSLSLPPVYYLSVPEIADERRILRSNRKAVSELFVSKENNMQDNNTNLTSSDIQFLSLAKTQSAQPKIKEILNTEALGEVKKDSSFINRIFSKNTNYLNPTIADYKNNTLSTK